VDRDDDVAVRLVEAGDERCRLAEVAAEADNADVLRRVVQPGQCCERPVGRAVVHEDGLPGHAERLERGGELVVEERDAWLPVVARIAAGVPAPRALERGEAMAIATGGVVPPGADAVIPIEYVVEDDNSVEISKSVGRRDNVRPRGGDVRSGGVVVSRGTRL